jgi:hypothetical protein
MPEDGDRRDIKHEVAAADMDQGMGERENDCVQFFVTGSDRRTIFCPAVSYPEQEMEPAHSLLIFFCKWPNIILLPIGCRMIAA